MGMWKNSRGFSGLEAAIVLIAFVIVAAVFSYIVLNMGFFSAEKTKETVSKGVTEASSTMTLAGDVIGWKGTTGIKKIKIPVKLGAGTTPIDLTQGKTVVSFIYEKQGIAESNIYTTSSACVNLTFVGTNNGDKMLDPDEKAEFVFDLSQCITGFSEVAPNDKFKLEIKPPVGAPLQIERTVPASVKAVASLS